MKHLFTLVFVGLFASEKFSAQENSNSFWSAANESEIKSSCVRQIIPKKYLTFRLNGSLLKDQLFAAPHEKSGPIIESRCIVTLPLPDGTTQKFHVVYSPVMAE